MTKDEFSSWKSSIATKEVFEVVQRSIRELEVTIAREAGLDEKSDRYKSGILKGLELVLNIDWEDEENA